MSRSLRFFKGAALFSIPILLFYPSILVSALVHTSLEREFDCPCVLSQVKNDPELKSLREQLVVLRKSLASLSNERIKELLGEEVKKPKRTFSVPCFSEGSFSVGGFGLNEIFRPKFYLLNQFAGVEFHNFLYALPRVRTIVFIYFRVDDEFVPLQIPNDLKERIVWDKKKLEQLRSWVKKNIDARIDERKILRTPIPKF